MKTTTTFIFSGLLFFIMLLVFIGLKQHSIIDWSWGFVLSPLYMMYIFFAFCIFKESLKKKKDEKND